MTEQFHPVRSFDGAPTFNHPELIRHLYENGFRIDRNILRDILALPRETLLDDLSVMLDDAKKRYEFFVEVCDQSPDRDFHERDLNFPLHALFLLQEIDCSRSFDLVLGFLKSKDSDCENNRDFIEFWFGDHIFETIWQIFFHLGTGREQELADFLFARHVDSTTKCTAATALQQMALHHPKRYQDIRRLFESVFQRFLDAEYDETLFDAHLVSMVLTDYIEICPIEVSPLARQLYENGLIETGYCGSYDSLMNRRVHGVVSYSQKIRDIFSIYDNVVATWAGYNPERKFVPPKLNFDKVPKWIDPESYATASQKHEVVPRIGRNDPCPCGSGKKYKKCCQK